jgi:hypothetical protein
MGDLAGMADWLRVTIEARRATAQAALHGGEGRWEQEDADRRPGLIVDERGEVVTYDEGSPTDEQTAHITDNDPRDTIARCEADLAILDEHAAVPDHGRFSDNPPGLCDDHCGCEDRDQVCRSCRNYAGDPREAPCRTVVLLASGYRHWSGYKPGWAV